MIKIENNWVYLYARDKDNNYKEIYRNSLYDYDDYDDSDDSDDYEVKYVRLINEYEKYMKEMEKYFIVWNDQY